MQGPDLSQLSNNGVKPGTREDGRQWSEFRNLIVSTNAVGSTPASASVRLGNTFVLAGVTTQLTSPARETPATGNVHLQVDISALASPTMHRLQAADTAAGLSHILNLHFTNPYVLNPCSLCVQPGQHCWEVRIDIVVLNDDGGLLDACMAAASSALKSLKLADMRVDPDTDKVVHHEASGVKQYVPLDIKATPSTMTFGVHDDQLLCDPCQQEAVKLTSSVQVTVAGHGHCSGIELQCKSNVSQALLKGAIQSAYTRNSAIQAMFA